MTEKYTPQDMADKALAKLEEIVEAGELPSCYDATKGDFWFDWWPDLPWDPESQAQAVQHLLTERRSRLDAINLQLVDIVGGMHIIEQLEINLGELRSVGP